jgi:hypothetical protein
LLSWSAAVSIMSCGCFCCSGGGGDGGGVIGCGCGCACGCGGDRGKSSVPRLPASLSTSRTMVRGEVSTPKLYPVRESDGA